MIKEIANKMTSLWVESNIISQDKQDIYEYGIKLVLSTCLSLLIIMAVAFVFHKEVEALIFIFFFILLRSASGGHHSGTYLGCFFKFLMIICLGLSVAHIILNQMPIQYIIPITGTVCVLSIILVIMYAPVDTPNKRFSNEETLLYREKSIKAVLFQGIILAMITYVDASMALAAGFGMLMQGMTLFPVFNK